MISTISSTPLLMQNDCCRSVPAGATKPVGGLMWLPAGAAARRCRSGGFEAPVISSAVMVTAELMALPSLAQLWRSRRERGTWLERWQQLWVLWPLDEIASNFRNGSTHCNGKQFIQILLQVHVKFAETASNVPWCFIRSYLDEEVRECVAPPAGEEPRLVSAVYWTEKRKIRRKLYYCAMCKGFNHLPSESNNKIDVNVYGYQRPHQTNATVNYIFFLML